VSWAELSTQGPPVLSTSPVEKERFGLTVDRLVVPESSPATDREVCEMVRESSADVVVARYPAARVRLFAELFGSGREALLADTLVYWRLHTGAGRRDGFAASGRAGVEGRLTAGPRALDEPTLRTLVADMFAGYGNHYLADPLFDPQQALAGYQDWATRSAALVPPVVLLRDDEPIALATVHAEGGAMEIELAGVVTREQGRGRYAVLLAAVEDAAEREGCREVVISTQGHNTGVQRAWARFGFEPVATFLTVHLLRSGTLSS